MLKVAATNEYGGVLIGVINNQVLPIRVTKSVSAWGMRHVYKALINKAAAKAGLVPDKRFKTGYRKIA